jgi:hypothetical protein
MSCILTGDFCQWKALTAEDSFGRFETDDVVSASNLFKYCQPCHGVVLMKHHDPLHLEGTASVLRGQSSSSCYCSSGATRSVADSLMLARLHIISKNGDIRRL